MGRFVVAFIIAVAWHAPAAAQESELAKIREEIRQMKQQYEQRIRDQKNRPANTKKRGGRAAPPEEKAEKRAAKAKTAGAAATPAAAPSGGGETALNPAISLILQGTYANTSQD